MNGPHTEVGQAHPDHGHAHPHPQPERGLHVVVLYNGVSKSVEFENQQTLGTLRQNAVNAFGDLPTPHLLSLFNAAGVEFGPDRDQQLVREAGIHNGDKLLLRPGVVRGG